MQGGPEPFTGCTNRISEKSGDSQTVKERSGPKGGGDWEGMRGGGRGRNGRKESDSGEYLYLTDKNSVFHPSCITSHSQPGRLRLIRGVPRIRKTVPLNRVLPVSSPQWPPLNSVGCLGGYSSTEVADKHIIRGFPPGGSNDRQASSLLPGVLGKLKSESFHTAKRGRIGADFYP